MMLGEMAGGGLKTRVSNKFDFTQKPNPRKCRASVIKC